jgi:hypothetical protein
VKYPLLTISADGSTPSRRNRHRKTRAFQCTLLRCVTWTKYKPSAGTHGKILRPIFLDYCGTESEHRAFTANLRAGRPAALSDRESIELLRSEPYVYAPPQRCAAGIRQIVYYPEVFDLDCKAQRDDVWLCAMPPESLLTSLSVAEIGSCRAALHLIRERIAEQQRQAQAENVRIEENNRRYYAVSYQRRGDLRYQSALSAPKQVELDDAAVRYWALMARELCVRLDARTRYPIPCEPEFRALLLVHLISVGVVHRSTDNPLAPLASRDDYRSSMPLRVDCPQVDYYHRDDAGYLPPLGLAISQEKLGETLAELSRDFYAKDVIS